MPRAKSLNTYPEELWTIVEACANRNESFELEVAGWREAARLQGQYYSFRGALRRELDSVAKKSNEALLGWQRRVEEALRNCEATVCWYDRVGIIRDDQPVKVRFMNKKETPQARLLRSMFAGKEVKTVEDQADDSAQRLLKKLQGELE